MRLTNVAIFCAMVSAMIWLSMTFLSESYEINKTTQIPPAPLIETVNFEGMDIKNSPQSSFSVRELFNPETLQVVDYSDIPNIGLDDDDLPLLWLLEVENFSESDKAKVMMQELRERGHSAFIHIADDTNTTSYYVYVGPKIDRRRLVYEKMAIDKAFSTDAVIMQFVR